MVCKIFFSSDFSDIAAKFWEKDEEEGKKKAIVKSYAFQASAIRHAFLTILSYIIYV